MITVIIYGLDQFVVERLSAEMTKNLADLYEVDEDEINFVAPSNMVFHKGVEQTSWNALIHVHAPMKVSVLQNDAANLIIASIGELAIHKTVEFYYYPQDNRYVSLNKEYPRYITDENSVNYEEDCCEDDDCDCHDYDEEDEEIYTGDIFEGIGEKKGN